MNNFLQPIVTELKMLENGICLQSEETLLKVSKKYTRFYLLGAIFDKPAKSAVLNMISFNGFGGCTKCLQLGETFETRKGGHSHIFPFKSQNPLGPLRTEKSYDDDVKSRNTSNGVLGSCCLSLLEYFHPISGTCIDYMHSILEGVVKSLFYRWFGQENYSLDCSLRCYLEKIDTRIISIRPPKFISTTPRSIYSWKTWRAHEYLSFILYYALPIFIDIMDEKQFNHLTKLVIFIEIILSREIKKMDLEFAETIIIAFVKDLVQFILLDLCYQEFTNYCILLIALEISVL